MQFRSKIVTLGVLACAALAPAGASADSLATPAGSRATLALTVASNAITAQRLRIEAASSFTAGDNGSQALTLFLVPPGGGSCPAGAAPPAGADVVLSGEAADQVLIVDVISAPLTRPGTWNVCAYLTAGATVTASGSQQLTVTGAPIPAPQAPDAAPQAPHAGPHGASHQSKAHHKAKAKAKAKKHRKP